MPSHKNTRLIKYKSIGPDCNYPVSSLYCEGGREGETEGVSSGNSSFPSLSAKGNKEYLVHVDLAQPCGCSPTLAGGWHDSLPQEHERGWASHNDIELYRLFSTNSPQRSAKSRRHLLVLSQRLRLSGLLAPRWSPQEPTSSM